MNELVQNHHNCPISLTHMRPVPRCLALSPAKMAVPMSCCLMVQVRHLTQAVNGPGRAVITTIGSMALHPILCFLLRPFRIAAQSSMLLTGCIA